jgi:transposase
LKIADREDGTDTHSGTHHGGGSDATASTPAAGGDLEAENRELRKRTKQPEQENEILCRATAYFVRDVLPKWYTRWVATWLTTACPSR